MENATGIPFRQRKNPPGKQLQLYVISVLPTLNRVVPYSRYRHCIAKTSDLRKISQLLLTKLSKSNETDPKFVHVFLGGSKSQAATWRQVQPTRHIARFIPNFQSKKSLQVMCMTSITSRILPGSRHPIPRERGNRLLQPSALLAK
jgi:hypothetical protein